MSKLSQFAFFSWGKIQFEGIALCKRIYISQLWNSCAKSWDPTWGLLLVVVTRLEPRPLGTPLADGNTEESIRMDGWTSIALSIKLSPFQEDTFTIIIIIVIIERIMVDGWNGVKYVFRRR